MVRNSEDESGNTGEVRPDPPGRTGSSRPEMSGSSMSWTPQDDARRKGLTVGPQWSSGRSAASVDFG